MVEMDLSPGLAFSCQVALLVLSHAWDEAYIKPDRCDRLETKRYCRKVPCGAQNV
jgi:hypothetical protein